MMQMCPPVPSGRGDHIEAYHSVPLVESNDQHSMQDLRFATDPLQHRGNRSAEWDRPLRTLRHGQAIDMEDDALRDPLLSHHRVALHTHVVSLQTEESALPKYKLGNLKRRRIRVRAGFLMRVTDFGPLRRRTISAELSAREAARR